MKVIVKGALKKFWERSACADARGPLHSWYEEALRAKWHRPQDIKDQFANASICRNNRVVFNLGGNKYRLVVESAVPGGNRLGEAHRHTCAIQPHQCGDRK